MDDGRGPVARAQIPIGRDRDVFGGLRSYFRKCVGNGLKLRCQQDRRDGYRREVCLGRLRLSWQKQRKRMPAAMMIDRLKVKIALMIDRPGFTRVLQADGVAADIMRMRMKR